MPAGFWRFDGPLLLLATATVVSVGIATGHWLSALAATLLPYLAWHLVNAGRFCFWLENPDRDPPRGLGIWSGIFAHADRLRTRAASAHTELEDLAHRFRDLTDALPDAMLAIDQNHAIEWFNKKASELLSLREEDLGRPVTHLLREPDFADWIAVQDRVESSLEMACPHKKHVLLRVSAVRYAADQRLLILRDITEVRNLEQVRRDFVANVSHELRTPLAVLLGYLETLSDQCPEEIRPAVDSMQVQARQVQALLSDLLDLARLQSDEYQGPEDVVDVPAMLMELKTQAEELSQGRHRLQFEVQPGLKIWGTLTDLESAFRNLVSNAISYTPERGSVTVRWEQTDEGAVMSVTDTGIGIPNRDLPRLTERFYRVGSGRSRSSGGTGLGLSIVKHVLNAHQARLLIESELGHGSRFACIFAPERVVCADAPARSEPA